MPSVSWCHNNGYMQKIELKGQETEVPDYKRALLEDEKLNFMLSKMSDVFVDLKYPLQDLNNFHPSKELYDIFPQNLHQQKRNHSQTI